jgi:hypothetical protein
VGTTFALHSGVNVVAAVEFMVVVLVMVHLNLNAVVVQLVFLSEQAVGLLKDALLLTVEASMESNVAGEGELVVVEGPDVHVVDHLDALDLLEAVRDLFDVYVLGDGFEDEDHALPEGHSCRPQHNEGEDVCADGVNIPELGPDKHNCGCNYDTDRVQQVAQNMEEGSLNV